MELDKRRTAFIEAAESIFERKGAAHTTINDITREVGVTRSLFYHYFDDKSALISAVIDKMVDDFVEHADQWLSETSEEGRRDRILHVIRLARDYLSIDGSMHNSFSRQEDGEYLQHFVVQASTRISERLSARMSPQSLSSLHHPRETIFTLVIGLICMLYDLPDTPENVYVDLIIDVLRLEN